MPHGGYHGTVVMGGNIIQQGDGQGGIQGGLGQAALNIPVNQPSQNNQNVNQQIEEKKKEIELLNRFQQGDNIDPQVDIIDQGFFPQNEGIMTSGGAGLAPGTTVYRVGGATGDTAKGLATLQNIQNQQLNNLLQQQQEINLANQVKSLFAKAGSDKETADKLRPLFTGDKGDKTFLGMNLGSTEQPAATVINPFTGERITTEKVREGMTSPQYAQYMSELYDSNPALMKETFPFASGQIASPFIVKALEAAKAAGSGIMGLPGVSELGQMGGDIVGAMLSPLSGLFTGETAKTPKIKYDNQGNIIDIISQAPDGGGDAQEVDKFGNPILPMGQYSSVPEEFMQGFMDSPFYKNVPGGAMISYVTLPDGREIKFGDTGSASQFRQYLESIGVMQPESTEDFKQVKSQPTGLPALADYASMAPQFTGSQYTNQGISPAFLENLRRFYG